MKNFFDRIIHSYRTGDYIVLLQSVYLRTIAVALCLSTPVLFVIDLLYLGTNRYMVR